MKYLVNIMLVVLILGTIWLTVDLALSADPPPDAEKPRRIHALMSVAKSYGSGVPECLEYAQASDAGTGPCTKRFIFGARPQIMKPSKAQFEMWVRWQGDLYHAHAIRLDGGAKWIWAFDGARIWLKGLKAWADSSTDVKGPYSAQVILENQAVCDYVAPRLFVNMTSDAGTLVPPRGGGAWPDATIANCGGGYYKVRNRFGGRSPMRWIYQAGDQVFGPTWAGRPVNVPQGVWDVPDARIYKSCQRVPIGTACP